MIFQNFCVTLQPKICLLDMNADYIVPLNGLSAGKIKFFWHVGKEFFVESGSSEILDADIDAEVIVEKSGNYIGVDCDLNGEIVVPCDRCMEDLAVPVSELISLSVKFGSEQAEASQHTGADDGRETVYLSKDEASLDMAQIIYDYSMLALPLQRVHAEGDCNPEAVKYLSSGEMASRADEVEERMGNNPFAALKDMFDN